MTLLQFRSSHQLFPTVGPTHRQTASRNALIFSTRCVRRVILKRILRCTRATLRPRAAASSSDGDVGRHAEPRSRVSDGNARRGATRQWRDVSRQVGVILTHQIFRRASGAAQVTRITAVVDPNAPFRSARTGSLCPTDCESIATRRLQHCDAVLIPRTAR